MILHVTCLLIRYLFDIAYNIAYDIACNMLVLHDIRLHTILYIGFDISCDIPIFVAYDLAIFVTYDIACALLDVYHKVFDSPCTLQTKQQQQSSFNESKHK